MSSGVDRDYDPRCGMSKEEFEWRWAQDDKVQASMPRAQHQMNILLQRMRSEFLGDPDALQKWDRYEKDVQSAFSRNLLYALSSPLYTPNSVMYAHLMKRKARARTCVGMVCGGLEKLKQATRNIGAGAIVASVAAGYAVGLAIGPTVRKQQPPKET